MARPSLRLFWAAAVALPVVIGDGEIFLSFSANTDIANRAHLGRSMLMHHEI